MNKLTLSLGCILSIAIASLTPAARADKGWTTDACTQLQASATSTEVSCVVVTSPVIVLSAGEVTGWAIWCPDDYPYFGDGTVALPVGNIGIPGGWVDSYWVGGTYVGLSPYFGKFDVSFANWNIFSGGGIGQMFMACTEEAPFVVQDSLPKVSQAARPNPHSSRPSNPYMFDLVEPERDDTLRITSQRWVKPNDTITLNLSCPIGMLPYSYDAAVGFYGTRKQALTHAPKVQIKETPLLRPNRGVRFTAKAGDIPERKLGFQTKVVCIRD